MTTILAFLLYLLAAWALWEVLPGFGHELNEIDGEIKKLDEMLRDEIN